MSTAQTKCFALAPWASLPASSNRQPPDRRRQSRPDDKAIKRPLSSTHRYRRRASRLSCSGGRVGGDSGSARAPRVVFGASPKTLRFFNLLDRGKQPSRVRGRTQDSLFRTVVCCLTATFLKRKHWIGTASHTSSINCTGGPGSDPACGRILAITTFIIVSARRRNQHARARSLPRVYFARDVLHHPRTRRVTAMTIEIIGHAEIPPITVNSKN